MKGSNFVINMRINSSVKNYYILITNKTLCRRKPFYQIHYADTLKLRHNTQNR